MQTTLGARSLKAAHGTAPHARSINRIIARSYQGLPDGRAGYNVNEATSAPGGKIQEWLSTPFDILAFGTRAGVGALVSLPDKLQSLQSDCNRAVELLQDPRPLDEKQTAVLREIEDTLVGFLEKGATIESDVFSNLKTVLPPEAANLIDELRPQPPSMATRVETPLGSVDQKEGDAAGPSVDEAVVYAQEDVQQSQISSEVSAIKDSVGNLRAALDAVLINVDASRTNMLKLNLRDARDQLSRRINEVNPATAIESNVAAAVREARILLDEVDAQFFTSSEQN